MLYEAFYVPPLIHIFFFSCSMLYVYIFLDHFVHCENNDISTDNKGILTVRTSIFAFLYAKFHTHEVINCIIGCHFFNNQYFSSIIVDVIWYI